MAKDKLFNKKKFSIKTPTKSGFFYFQDLRKKDGFTSCPCHQNLPFHQPPIPPIPGMPLGAADLGFGLSVIMTAMVIKMPEIDAAFVRALLVTRTGSMTPSFTRSLNSSFETVIAKITGSFIDLLSNQIALLSTVVCNGSSRCKGRIADDLHADHLFC